MSAALPLGTALRAVLRAWALLGCAGLRAGSRGFILVMAHRAPRRLAVGVLHLHGIGLPRLLLREGWRMRRVW